MKVLPFASSFRLELAATETFVYFRPYGVEVLVGFRTVEVGRKRSMSPALAGLVAEVV